jgi:hypothetical protein
MDVEEFERYLLCLAEEYAHGGMDFRVFWERFYLEGYFASDKPGEELAEKGEFFDDVCERMEYTTPDYPTEENRDDAYISADELRLWLQKNLAAYRAGTYVDGNPLGL